MVTSLSGYLNTDLYWTDEVLTVKLREGGFIFLLIVYIEALNRSSELTIYGPSTVSEWVSPRSVIVWI